MSNKVFICHSSSDHGFVLFLAEKMKEDKINVWIDDWEIKVGDSIVQKITAGLGNSSFFVVVLSENSIKSDWVEKELDAALMRSLTQKDIKILPVLLDLDASSLPFLLTDIKAAKFTTSRIDALQYQQFIGPIKDKQKGDILNKYEDRFFENAAHIDSILQNKKPSRQEVKFVLELIKEEHYNRYFFKKAKNQEWFELIKNEGYFNPQSVPEPIKEDGEVKVFNSEKYSVYSIPKWDVLDYLEALSMQYGKSDDNLSCELLTVVNNVTRYHVQNSRVKDNPTTWWYFTKILINISNETTSDFLNQNSIDIEKDWLKEWITTKYRNSLTADEIGTKLLPKFLTGRPEDLAIAEKIVRVITAFEYEPVKKSKGKQLKDKLDFAIKKEGAVYTLIEPYWLNESFKKNSDRIGELCSPALILYLADKLQEALVLKHGIGYSKTEVFRKNLMIISANRKKNSFDFSIELKQLTQKEYDELFSGGIGYPGGTKLAFFEIKDIHDKESFVKQIRLKLTKGRHASLVKSSGFDDKLISLYRWLYDDYSYIWFKFLDEERGSSLHETDALLTSILKDILMAKCRHKPDEALNILKEFVTDSKYKFPLFRRLLLYAVKNDWNRYKELFWQVFDNNPLLLELPDYEMELIEIFKTNAENFTVDEKAKIRTRIEKGPDTRFWSVENKDLHIAAWKQKWSSALSKIPWFSKIANKMKTVTKISFAEKQQKSETGLDERSSVLSKEEMLKLPNTEIVKIRKEDIKKKDSPLGGFEDMLASSAKENPNKFLVDMKPFWELGYLDIYSLLWGIWAGWNEDKKIIDWDKLLDFIEQYISQKGFWEDESRFVYADLRKPDHKWVVNVIGTILAEVSRKTDWIMPNEKLPQATRILFNILDKIDEPKLEHREYMNSALNSQWGRTIEALILVELRSNKLSDDFKKRYKKTMSDKMMESFTWFGYYLRRFLAIDQEWTKTIVNEISSSKKKVYWESFMTGFLLTAFAISKDAYNLMKQTGNYDKGLLGKFKDTSTEESLAKHICIGFLNGLEDINDSTSLMQKLLKQYNPGRIRAVIHYFWMRRKFHANENFDIVKNEKEKILEFWKWCFDNREEIQNKLGKDYGQFFSDLSLLTVFLDKIDEESNSWLTECAPFVDKYHKASFFIEYLDAFKDNQSIKFIGKIFLEMLNGGSTPLYNQKHIVSIVTKLYDNNEDTNADKICATYGARGHEFLNNLNKNH